MSLKIVVVHNRYRHRGGEDEVFDAETELLAARGHRVERLCVDSATIEDRPGARAAIAVRMLWNASAARDAGRLLDAVRPDVMHVHNTFPMLSPSVAAEARKRNVPVVMTLHNYRLACMRGDFYRDGSECLLCLRAGRSSPGIRYRCYRGSRPASIAAAVALDGHRALRAWRRYVSLFIAPSDTAATLLAPRLPEASILVKPHFLPDDPGRGSGGATALYAGRLSEEKGLRVVLKAWRRHPDLPRLFVAGNGPERRQLEDVDPDRIVWLGELERKSVLEALGRSRLLVSGSLCRETFGLTVIEAFARATPVVVPAGTALAELVGDGLGGCIYTRGDPDALAAAVRSVESPATLTTRREAARRAFEARFTAQHGYDGLMDAYGRAIASA